MFRRSTRLLDALELGEPAEVPVWMLGGHTVPDERIRELKRGDRTITGWVVNADDIVVPLRGWISYLACGMLSRSASSSIGLINSSRTPAALS